jgi:hypothetical protein
MFIDHHQKKLEESFGDEESEALRTAMNAQLKERFKKTIFNQLNVWNK